MEAAAERLQTYWHSSHHSNRLAGSAANVHRDLDGQAKRLWGAVRAAMEVVGQETVALPESRTVHIDWVRDDVHMPK